MGISRHNCSLHRQCERMIDVAGKPQSGKEELMEMRVTDKSHSYREVKKHDAVNLPMNILSDSEDHDDGSSSEDNNCAVILNSFQLNGIGHNLNTDEVTCNFRSMTLSGKQNVMDEILQKLVKTVIEWHQDDCKDKDLKARGGKKTPKQRETPYTKHDLTVTTCHGNGGRVIIQKLLPNDSPENGYPGDQYLLAAIEDPAFMESFVDKLTANQLDQVIREFSEKNSQERSTIPKPEITPYTSIMSPDSNSRSVISPFTPNSGDLYDSCYETGSPGSTVVTSPGSPSCFSPSQTSNSSESDQELSSNADKFSTQNTVTVSTTSVVSEKNEIFLTNLQPSRSIAVKPELAMRPLGEDVFCTTTSATQRLYELSKSTNFCKKHFTIQLVRVFMTTAAEQAADKIEAFRRSLLSIMKTTRVNRAYEWDIWQLSIYAHIQFLKAPDRLPEYRLVLLNQEESLLHIAAIKHHEKPVIARYIAESMSQVGYSPFKQEDENGNTILHLLAEQGDSHVHMLCELLMAAYINGEQLSSVLRTNNKGQSALHVAVQSDKPHLTTVLKLLRVGARPLDQDKNNMTALQYHIKHMTRQVPTLREDLEVVKKMVQASIPKESVQILNQLLSDSSIPREVYCIIHNAVKNIRN